MNLQVLLSTVNSDENELLKMNISSSYVIVCQCGKDAEKAPIYYSSKKGVGNSRNLAITKSKEDILLFADDDVVYTDTYEKDIIKEFENHKDADMIIFNVDSLNSKRPFANTDTFSKVSMYNCFKYGTPQIAVRRDFIIKNNITFSTEFGGGAKYSAGEDNLFIVSTIKSGGKVFASPVKIGVASQLESTWFSGYNKKYFNDKGAFYKAVSNIIYPLFIFNYAFRHSHTLKEIGVINAIGQMFKGAIEY